MYRLNICFLFSGVCKSEKDWMTAFLVFFFLAVALIVVDCAVYKRIRRGICKQILVKGKLIILFGLQNSFYISKDNIDSKLNTYATIIAWYKQKLLKTIFLTISISPSLTFIRTSCTCLCMDIFTIYRRWSMNAKLIRLQIE